MIETIFPKKQIKIPDLTERDLTISDGTVYVPDRFVKAVLSHVLLVNIDVGHNYRFPLILAIQGPPGTGKSFQAQYTLEYYKIKTVVLDSSTLASRYEGESITALQETYCKLGVRKLVSAIIIDDFDMSIGAQKKNMKELQTLIY